MNVNIDVNMDVNVEYGCEYGGEYGCEYGGEYGGECWIWMIWYEYGYEYWMWMSLEWFKTLNIIYSASDSIVPENLVRIGWVVFERARGI